MGYEYAIASEHRFEVGDLAITNPKFDWGNPYINECPFPETIYKITSIRKESSDTGFVVTAESTDYSHSVDGVSSSWFFPFLEWK